MTIMPMKIRRREKKSRALTLFDSRTHVISSHRGGGEIFPLLGEGGRWVNFTNKGAPEKGVSGIP